MDDAGDTLLTAFLAGREQPCPQCEYNLRDLQGNGCPECGEELVLRVNVAERRQRLLIAGSIGLSSGAGFNGLLIVYAVINAMRFSYSLPAKFWPIIFTGFCIFAAITFIWLGYWRWLRRRSQLTRLTLAVGCWFLALADIVIFAFNIR